MHMTEPFERAVDHLIDETVGAVQCGNFGNEALRHPKMTALECNEVAEFEQTLGPPWFNDAL